MGAPGMKQVYLGGGQDKTQKPHPAMHFMKKGGIETFWEEDKKTTQVGGRSLADGVQRMASVFEQATQARDEQRQMMDDLHEGQMRHVDAMNADCERLMNELVALIHGFVSKFEGQAGDTKNILMEELNANMAGFKADLDRFDARAKAIQVGIDKEREARLQHTDDILAPIRKQVGKLALELDKEQRIRRTRDAELSGELTEAVANLNSGVDFEVKNREQRHIDTITDIEREHSRLVKRQHDIVERGAAHIETLNEDTEKERTHRIKGQDHLVLTITGFIKQFQADIKEEGEMG